MVNTGIRIRLLRSVNTSTRMFWTASQCKYKHTDGTDWRDEHGCFGLLRSFKYRHTDGTDWRDEHRFLYCCAV